MDGRRSGAVAALLGLSLAALTPGVLLAQANDLREFRLGMQVDELPRAGYVQFTCAAAPSTALAGWSEYGRCPADAAGRREVRFRYDEDANPMARVNDDYEGTKIGGHPVLISLIIGDAGRLDGIRIATDPKARLYLRKKAFLFGRQAKERYGEGDWSCTQGQLGAGEEPVGGVFLREHCEKTTESRRFVLDRELYRRAGEPLKDFVSNTELAILRKD